MANAETILFYDHDADQNGHAFVRPYGQRVTIGFALETGREIEATVDREVVEELVRALQAAITEAA